MYNVNQITSTKVQALKYGAAILMVITVLALGFFIGTATPAKAVEATPTEPAVNYQQMYQELLQAHQALQQEKEADQQVIRKQDETITNLTQDLEAAKAENGRLIETFGTAYYVTFQVRRIQKVFPSENIITFNTQVSKETFEDLEFGDQLPLTSEHFTFPSNTNNVTWTISVIDMYPETIDLAQ